MTTLKASKLTHKQLENAHRNSIVSVIIAYTSHTILQQELTQKHKSNVVTTSRSKSCTVKTDANCQNLLKVMIENRTIRMMKDAQILTGTLSSCEQINKT